MKKLWLLLPLALLLATTSLEAATQPSVITTESSITIDPAGYKISAVLIELEYTGEMDPMAPGSLLEDASVFINRAEAGTALLVMARNGPTTSTEPNIAARLNWTTPEHSYIITRIQLVDEEFQWIPGFAG